MDWKAHISREPSQAKTSASTNTEPPWEPATWKHPYTEMVRQHVDGKPIRNIAMSFHKYGVTYSGRHIRRIIESSQGRELASLMSAERSGGVTRLQAALSAFLPEAVHTELGIMRNPMTGERHRLAASMDLLDRGGIPKISRQESDNKLPTTIVVNLLPSQLKTFLAPPPIMEAEVVDYVEPDRLPAGE